MSIDTVHIHFGDTKNGKVITKLLGQLRTNDLAVEILERWGLQLDDGFKQIDARRLQNETLYFGGGHREAVGAKADWGRAVATKKMLVAKNLKTWAFVFPAWFEKDAKGFCMTLIDQSARLGMQVAKPKVIPLPSDRIDAYLKAIKELPDEAQLVVTLFGEAQRSDHYGAVKKLCYIERPIASQVLLQKTISNGKRLMSVAQKVALQMNCKLGGELWSIKLDTQRVMTVGIDIYRDKASGKSSKMIAGIVCSMNEANTRFFSQVIFEEQEKDFKQEILEVLIAAIEKFRMANGCYPKHLVVFRDGVSSGQLEMVTFEAEHIGEAIFKASRFEGMSITIAIVQRSSMAKFFMQNRPVYFENPVPGLIVDHSVVRRAWYDFYIVPVCVSQGTVTPTHITVLYDSLPLSADVFQRIAYSMTFMYFNWTGTVKVPAQCQYAHKLAKLVGEHLHGRPHASLAETLYYL